LLFQLIKGMNKRVRKGNEFWSQKNIVKNFKNRISISTINYLDFYECK
jgi:hypothetical protein